jgi:hypothetical protein
MLALTQLSGFGGGGGAGPISVTVIGTNSTGGTGATAAITVPAGGVPAGATIFVGATSNFTSTTGVTCADTAGNTYVIDLSRTNDNTCATYLFRSSTGLALNSGDTITVTFNTAGGGTHGKLTEAIYVQNLASSPLDKTASSNGSSTSPNSGNTATTTAGAELIIGVAGWGSGASITEDGSYTTDGAPVAVSNVSGHLAHRIVSATGVQNYAPFLGGSSTWSALCATYLQ